MQKPSDHPELFKLRPNAKPKFHRQLAYWTLPTKAVVELSDGELLDITKQSAGPTGHPRLYTNVPGYGYIQGRNLKALLAQLALIDQIRALNRSIQVKLKQQDDAARMLSDLTRDSNANLSEENARLFAELEAEKEKSARLRDELEALRRCRPEPSTNASADLPEGFTSAVQIVRPELESVVGHRPAIVLQRLSWLLSNDRFGVVLGGQKFIFNTHADWQRVHFPNWSEVTVRRAFKRLEKDGWVNSKQPEGRRSRRKYYTLSPEAIKLIGSGRLERSKRSLPGDQDDPIRNRSKRSLPITKNKNTSKHEHDHVHGPYGYSVEELQPDEQDLLNQIEELIERENRAEHFRATWLIRIREHPNDVFKAVGQTRLDVREGKIKKSIGGMLNWHFLQFQQASAKAARTAREICSCAS
jgi:DNA-binding PadR family transcriptional regulator